MSQNKTNSKYKRPPMRTGVVMRRVKVKNKVKRKTRRIKIVSKISLSLIKRWVVNTINEDAKSSVLTRYVRESFGVVDFVMTKKCTRTK
jgi:hypothetical protein